MRRSSIGMAMFEIGKTRSPDLPGALNNAVIALFSGTRCGRSDFIRSAEIVQTRATRSISCQVAPITSPVRAAVRIVKASARAKRCHFERKVGP